ncbi:hypothetical protein B6U74_01215 [Candidatus Bathyarchaeota archaeon ex4484_205]|nr:MAG: hypothetical protein B6U74_01215 [Candidatus Bathyarchaeota archaeon ex4484_205]
MVVKLLVPQLYVTGTARVVGTIVMKEYSVDVTVTEVENVERVVSILVVVIAVLLVRKLVYVM